MSETALPAVGARAPQAGVAERFWGWARNPWGQARFLVVVTWLFMAWSIVPILLAMLFSFNAGKSRSVWQGFSIHWWWGTATNAVFQTPQYFDAIQQSLKLAAVDVAISTPLGVALALGLVRWRGWGQKPANMLMLFPLVTPELVMAVSLFLILTQISVFPFGRGELGTTAQAIGQVTFSVSYVVVIVRARLLSIGREYEEAARDLGATSGQALRLALFPLLYPAIFAGAMIVFATSIDDFVVTQYMSSGGNTQTIPMLIYGNARGGSTTPALNAVATILVILTVVSLALAFFVYRLFSRGEKGQSTQTAIGDFGAFELS
jgi:spermidine/putrescine transport system permease protein